MIIVRDIDEVRMTQMEEIIIVDAENHNYHNQPYILI